MSAIAGIISYNQVPINSDYSRKMMKSLEKFPTNDIGMFQKDNAFLGCHSQWITPESVGEPLPFYDSERQCAITADAIIDNRDELFDKLDVNQNIRKSMPDSQLILRAYYKWGEECPKHLVGDFAFMIWDERSQCLIGARDLSGYRTLYYYQDHSVFAFATLIDTILTLPFTKKTLDKEWFAEYLAITGTIDTVGASTTPYMGIKQLPPAHIIIIKNDNCRLSRYGTLYSKDKIKFKSDEEYVEAFQEVFQKAVTSRLRSHRKIGAQLSGGLDSGAVAGFAAKELQKQNKKLHTFSYIPPSDFVDYTPKQLMADERPFIKSTIDYVGNIQANYLDFEGQSPYSVIDEINKIMEIPYKFFENSFWLKGIFEAAGKQDIGILLNGDRGNFSVSWGYALDYYSRLLKQLRWVKLFKELDYYSKNVGGARLGRLPLITKIGFPTLAHFFSQGHPYKVPGIINSQFAKKTGIFEKLKSHGIGETGWVSATDIYDERRILFDNMYPWNTGNVLTSKLSLRNSLWKRDPTNDIRVVRFCLAVPEEQYVNNGLDRALIRNATKGILPDKVRLNQQTRGVQGVDWVHRMTSRWGTFINELEQLSADKRAYEFFNMEAINKSLSVAKEGPQLKFATDSNYKILMRTLIAYRFIKNLI